MRLLLNLEGGSRIRISQESVPVKLLIFDVCQEKSLDAGLLLNNVAARESAKQSVKTLSLAGPSRPTQALPKLPRHVDWVLPRAQGLLQTSDGCSSFKVSTGKQAMLSAVRNRSFQTKLRRLPFTKSSGGVLGVATCLAFTGLALVSSRATFATSAHADYRYTMVYRVLHGEALRTPLKTGTDQRDMSHRKHDGFEFSPNLRNHRQSRMDRKHIADRQPRNGRSQVFGQIRNTNTSQVGSNNRFNRCPSQA